MITLCQKVGCKTAGVLSHLILCLICGYVRHSRYDTFILDCQIDMAAGLIVCALLLWKINID